MIDGSCLLYAARYHCVLIQINYYLLIHSFTMQNHVDEDTHSCNLDSVLLSENELATERVRGCKEANVPCLPLCPLASTLSATSILLTSTSTTNTSLLTSNLSVSTLHTILLAQLSNQIIALAITLLPSSGQPPMLPDLIHM